MNSSRRIRSLILGLAASSCLQSAPVNWVRAPEVTPEGAATRARLDLRRSPLEPLGYEDLALASLSQGHMEAALRALSSLVDLAPRDPTMLCRAGFLALKAKRTDLAREYLQRAYEQRPDRANPARALALAQWAEGHHRAALATLFTALEKSYPSRFGPVKGLLRDLAQRVLDAWERTGVAQDSEVQALRSRIGTRSSPEPRMQISLQWQSEADDVDLLVADPGGQICSTRERQTPSGMSLLADVSQGLGPEVILVPEGAPAGEYSLGVQDYRPGAVGVVRGLILVLRPSRGCLPEFEVHPFTLTSPEDRDQAPLVHQVATVIAE